MNNSSSGNIEPIFLIERKANNSNGSQLTFSEVEKSILPEKVKQHVRDMVERSKNTGYIVNVQGAKYKVKLLPELPQWYYRDKRKHSRVVHFAVDHLWREKMVTYVEADTIVKINEKAGFDTEEYLIIYDKYLNKHL